MRVRSEFNWIFKFVVWITVAVLTLSMLNALLNENNLATVVFLVLIVFLLWLYYGTYYELREDYLYCRSGPFFERIFYDQIKSVRIIPDLHLYVSLPLKRIEIRRHNRGYILGTTFITPQNREEFFYQLINKCTNLEDSKKY